MQYDPATHFGSYLEKMDQNISHIRKREVVVDFSIPNSILTDIVMETVTSFFIANRDICTPPLAARVK